MGDTLIIANFPKAVIESCVAVSRKIQEFDMRLLSIFIVLSTMLLASAAQAAVPMFNATCASGIEVHADDGGPVYVNGKDAKLKTSNSNYYEATQGRTTISIAINPDGSPSVSYTGRGGANGVCTLVGDNADNQPSQLPQDPASSAVDMSGMPRFCAGEASAEYGVKPTEITTNMAFKSGNNYVVQGNFDGDNGSTFFNCYFDISGNFQSIT